MINMNEGKCSQNKAAIFAGLINGAARLSLIAWADRLTRWRRLRGRVVLIRYRINPGLPWMRGDSQ